MREVRIPAQCVTAFEGKHTLSSNEFLQVAKIITQDTGCQPVLPPNFCDHSLNQPKLFKVPPTHKPRAKIVQETLKRLMDAYHAPKRSLKTLQFHDDTGHQVRSQRREAAIALLQVMVYYQDDATGRIGRQVDDGAFRDLSLAKLAKYADIAYRRAKRALEDIVRAGYLQVTRQFLRNPETGEVRGLPSIRKFLPKLFTDLAVDGSVWTKWYTQRDYARNREAKKTTKQQKKRSRALMGLVKEQIGSISKSAKKAVGSFLGVVKGVPKEPSQKETERLTAYRQKQYKKALDLFNLDPSKTPSEYLKALQEAEPFK